MLLLFLKSLVLGFSIAAPVGPIGVLCIRRTLAEGRAIGFVSGLGAATADAFYGAVAAFGLTLVSNFLTGESLWLRLLGGAFLILLGARTFAARPPRKSEARDPRRRTHVRMLAAYLSTLGLTITNPATILSFVAMFAALGVGAGKSLLTAGSVVAGVLFGSAIWWLTLALGVGALRSRFTAAMMTWMNRISGLCLMGFGAAVALSTVL